MMIFPRSPIWDVIWEPAKTITSFSHISEDIARKYMKCRPEVHQDFGSNGFHIQLLKCCRKQVITKIP